MSDTASVPRERRFALLSPREAPVLLSSSPHQIGLDEFAARFGGSVRRDTLLAALRARLARLDAAGASTECLLIGGGFVRQGTEPGDLDALLVYRLREPAHPDAALAALRERVDGLDLRLVPADAGAALLMRMGCFFHTLYQSIDRGGGGASFLVTPGRG